MVSDILIKDNQLMTTIAVGAGENIKDPLSRLAESWCPGTRMSFIMPGYIHFSRFFLFFFFFFPFHPLPATLFPRNSSFGMELRISSPAKMRVSQQSIPPSLSFLREKGELFSGSFPRFVRVLKFPVLSPPFRHFLSTLPLLWIYVARVQTRARLFFFNSSGPIVRNIRSFRGRWLPLQAADHISSTISPEAGEAAAASLYLRDIESSIDYRDLPGKFMRDSTNKLRVAGKRRVSEEGIEKLRPRYRRHADRSAYLETIENSRVREYLTGSLIALFLHGRVKIRITTTRRVIN